MSIKMKLARAGAMGAAAVAILAGTIGAANAELQTDTIPGGASSGTLANGVEWSTGNGPINPDGAIDIGARYDAPIANTLTLSEGATELEYDVRGLLGRANGNECIFLPAGTEVVTLSPNHRYNAANRRLCGTGSDDDLSTFRVVDPGTVQFRMDADSNPGNLHALILNLRVTADVDTDEEIPLVTAPLLGAGGAVAAAGAVPIIARKRKAAASMSS